MSRPRLVALLLALTTLVVFLPVGGFHFVNFDDTDYITDNPVVKHGLTPAGVVWAFTGYHVSNWHPVTWLSHMADCSLFGVNPGAMHFVNVLFHAANAALLFILFWRLTQRLWPSALVAALFAWHPLHVESVAWISERKDVLSTFFALMSLLNYAKYAKENCRQSFWFALIFFALGLMSKPMLVTLPFVLLLLDYWPLKRFSPAAFRPALLTEKIPFFLLAAISCVVTFLAQRSGEAVISLDSVSLGYRLENAPLAAARYLQKIFWPAGLCAIYPLPEKIPALPVVLSVAVLLLISAAAWRWRKSRPYFITGWLWFLGTLVPVIGLVQVGGQAMADRYTYLPAIGFFIALVFLGDDFADRLHTPRVIRFGLAGLVSLVCILATENQLQFWRDSETLFRRAIAVTENNDIALVNLGVALDVQDRFDEALAVYHQAEKCGSRHFEVHNNLGNVLGLLDRHAESLAEYREAIRHRPDNPKFHNAAGTELAALSRWDEALAEFSEAETLNPNYAVPHVEAAKVLFKLGRDIEGLDEFHVALQVEPDNYKTLATVAHYLAANENAAARNGPAALALARQADELSGHGQPVVLDFLGMAFAANGDFTNAVACAQNALALANAAHMNNVAPLQKRLELYQQNQPWRESFRATNAQ
jgi:tetratricopeptide (TPR) repeat protein